MSYFEMQEDAWFANNCKGNPSDYTPEDFIVLLDNEKDKLKGASNGN